MDSSVHLICGLAGYGICGLAGYGICGLAGYGICGLAGYGICGLAGYGICGLAGYGICGLAGYGICGLAGYGICGLAGYGICGLAGYGICSSLMWISYNPVFFKTAFPKFGVLPNHILVVKGFDWPSQFHLLSFVSHTHTKHQYYLRNPLFPTLSLYLT